MPKMHPTPSWLMARPIKTALALGLIVLLFVTGVYINQQPADPTANHSVSSIKSRLPEPRPLTPFQLDAHDQKPLNLGRLKDKWTFLFLGYTHCPDVCPTTLTEVAQTIQQLEPAVLKETQFVFVSVDPERDTPASLAEYVSYFDERLLGATGSIEALKVLVRQLGAKFSLEVGPTGEAIVNHSSNMLLIDPQVRYYARLKAPHYAEEIRAQYLALRDHYQRNLSATKQ